MILLEVVDAEQRKKVAKAVSSSNPDETVVFTQRHHDVLEPPPPPSPRLPDYATSQAQAEQQEIIKKSQQGQRKLGRALIYALVIYVVLSVAIAIPLIILVRSFSSVLSFFCSTSLYSGDGVYYPQPTASRHGKAGYKMEDRLHQIPMVFPQISPSYLQHTAKLSTAITGHI